MFKHILTGITLLIVSTQMNARGIDLRLADKVASIEYLSESSTFGYGGADVGIGFLFNSRDDTMFSTHAMVSGNGAGNNRSLKFGIGVKGVAVLLNGVKDTAGAVAIGAQIRYLIPASAPVALMAEAYAAPQITSFSGLESYSETRFAIELEVTPSARAYVGYRRINIGLGTSSRAYLLDDSAHVGIKLSF